MSKIEKSIIIIGGTLIILAVLFFIAKPVQQSPPQSFVAALDPSPQSSGCSQCLGNNCYSAPCNMDCILVGNGCETRVAGGAQQEYTPEIKANNGDYAEFYLQRVLKSNQAMTDAGIVYGDTIEKVNGVYAGSDLEFAKLVLKLPRGTVLRVWGRDGKTRDVTL